MALERGVVMPALDAGTLDWPHQVRACAREDCGETFKPKRKGQAYCSNRCRNTEIKRRQRSGDKTSSLSTVTTETLSDASAAMTTHQRGPGARPLTIHKGILKRSEFVWRGLGLHFQQRRKPILTLVQDEQWPHLYRITYPDGWRSTLATLTRCRDAAFGHARVLLTNSKDG